MNDIVLEFLKISLGIIVGGAVTAPFKVLSAYNSTRVSIGALDQKLENLSDLLKHWERGFVEAKIRSERLEAMLDSLDRRLIRAETILESLEDSRNIPE